MNVKTEPNVVPLCDILLVLLIIFMIITPVAQAGIDIALPERGGGKKEPTIVVTLDKNGTLAINSDKFTNRGMFEMRLKEIYGVRRDKLIFVQSDKEVPYKKVVSIVDLIKGCGVETVCMMMNKGKSAHLKL